MSPNRLIRVITAGGIGLALVAACSPGGAPSESPSDAASAAASPSADPTPAATAAGTFPALVVKLGEDTYPLDVTVAFGSVWVANHHTDDVLRFDPDTGARQAQIVFTDGTGPGWFAADEAGLWMTRQNTMGMAHIDATTEEIDDVQAGSLPPCWQPAVGLGGAWYFACDTGRMARIDLVTHEETLIPADGLSGPIVVDGVLYASGPEGVVRLAEDGETWTLVGGCCGRPIGYAGGTLWLADAAELVRVDLASGAVAARIPIPSAVAMTAGADIAWFAPAEGSVGALHRVRLSDNAVLDDVPVSATAIDIHLEGTVLWMTDAAASELWRIDVSE